MEICANVTEISLPTGCNGKSGVLSKVVRLLQKISVLSECTICVSFFKIVCRQIQFAKL